MEPEPLRFSLLQLLLLVTGVAILLGVGAAWGLAAVVGLVLACLIALAVYLAYDAYRTEQSVSGLVMLLLATLTIGGCFLLSIPATSWRSPPGYRMQCSNNLKQLALAMHMYHDVYGSFPPANVADDQGQPMHSWRVLLLPYIEQQSLYNRYRFDEPWDGPNNRQLADVILHAYQCPPDHRDADGSQPLGETSYVLVVGPGTVFPGAAATSIDDIKDGTTDTLLIVEVENSGIHWMEPRDLHVGQMAPTIIAVHGQGISSPHNGGGNAAFADGSVQFLPDTLSAAELRAMLTIDGGEAVRRP